MMHLRVCSIVWAAMSIAAAGPVGAAELLRIEGVVWGFDGTAVPNAFNPVSFSLHNDSNEPMSLPLRLVRSNGVEPVDAPIGVQRPDEPVFLAPQSSRRVQLFVYLQNAYGDATLVWGPSPGQRQDLTSGMRLPMGPAATVILYDPESVSLRGGALPRFDETFFPVSASGTAGLAAVVLDHVPRWQAAQQQAFRDWLQAGGVVHLLRAAGDEFPRFSAELAELNAPTDEQVLGSGRVVRHPVPMASLTREYVEANILSRGAQQLADPPPASQANPLEDQAYQPYYGGWVDWDTANHVFSRVKQMTRPDHSWGLIYLMSFVYLLIIFPGCWMIGRRRADYRLTYGAMLGAVALFSMGFKTVGQRGYGEQTALHAMTLAQPLDNGRLLFRQWGNLFVTDGDDYRIRHAGDGLLYSSGQSIEAVRGWIVSPPAGEFIADVPPFSSRTIAAAGVAASGGFTPAVETLQIGERLDALRVRLSAPLPYPPLAAHALYRDQVYLLGVDGSTIELRAGGQPLQTFLQTERWQEHSYGSGFWGPQEDAASLFESGMRPLLAAALGLADNETYQRFRLSGDRVRVFLFAEMPEELFPVLEYQHQPGRALEAKRAGRILYTFDVFAPQ